MEWTDPVNGVFPHAYLVFMSDIVFQVLKYDIISSKSYNNQMTGESGLFNAIIFVYFNLSFSLCNFVLLSVTLWYSYYTKPLKESSKFHKEKLHSYINC